MEQSNSISVNKTKKISDTIDKTPKDINQNESINHSPKKTKKKKDDGMKDRSSYNKKKKVTWTKNLVSYVDVASYKKYNLENCHDDPNMIKEKTRCNCVIF